MKVYVHFAEGFEEIEAVCIVDVLRRAGIETQMISVTGDKIVAGAHGIRIETDLLFEQADYKSCGMIVLPGGMPGTTNLGRHQGLAGRISAFTEEGKWLAAICAAPIVFGQIGLLKGKTAVVFPGYEDKLIGAKIGRHSVEVDGKIITSRGPGTAFDFALMIVELLRDKTSAKSLRQSMLVE
jgi:protein deglycase